jgi:hypothetical protein
LQQSAKTFNSWKETNEQRSNIAHKVAALMREKKNI